MMFVSSKSMPSHSKSLGPLLALSRRHPLRWIDFFTWIALGIVSVLLPLLYGFYRRNNAYKNFGPVAATIWSRPWFVLALFALIVFLILAIYRLLLTRRFVAVHKRGVRLSLSKQKTLLWAEIAGIATNTTQYQFIGRSLITRHFALLYPNIGKPIHLDNSLQELPELLTLLKAKLYPRISPVLQSDFNQGKWLHFGPISIQQNIIQINKKQYAWSDVEHISVNRGKLNIYTNPETKHTLPVSKIPNIELLLQIIQQEVKV